MNEMSEAFTSDDLAAAFAEHKGRLEALVKRRFNPVLLKRLSHEDVMQEAYLAAARRLHFFRQHDDVPLYFKLRTVLMQTIADIERRHLQAGGRDIMKEAEIADNDDTSTPGSPYRNAFAADITSPVSRVDRDERHALLRNAVAALPENDRAILVLRHFDRMGNNECAAALGIEPKAASIRYVRALERLKLKLTEITCFQKNR